MNNKLLVATAVASLTFATAAFAQGENEPFPLRLTLQTETVGNPPRDTGSQAYPAPLHTLSSANPTVALLPSNGGNGGVESVNSRPADFAVGTEAYTDAQRLAQWQARQQQVGFAAAPAATPAHGG